MAFPENPIPVSPPIAETSFVSPSSDEGKRLDEHPSWGFWEILGLVVTAFVAMLGSILGLASFIHHRFFPAEPLAESLKRPEVIVGGQLLAYVLVLLVMYAIVSSQNQGRVLEPIRWNWPKNWGVYLLAGIALDLCLLPLAYLLPMPKHAPIDDFFRTARDAYVLSVFGVFCAPLLEELFFRGFLYPWLARHVRMIPAIVITSLFFASIHAFQLKYSWGPVLVIFLVGVALTTVRALKKSVAATVLMHMAYNGAIFVAAYIATSGFRHMEYFNQ